MKLFQGAINEICQSIIRPVRAQYQQYDLGPTHYQGDVPYIRQDIEVINNRHQTLRVSIFQGKQASQSCVIYLHSLNGSRLEVFKHIPDILKHNHTLVTFDFSGSGRSDGDIVTYGHREVFDLHSIIQHIQNQMKSIILWGRSMGSVVALLYMEKFNNPLVKGLVLDSPFTSLQDIVVLMAQRKSKLPNFILRSLSGFVSDQLKQTAGFALEDINCLNNITQVTCPAYFITSKVDTVVPVEQTERLYRHYNGSKQIHYTGQDHNAIRDSQLFEQIMQWFKKRSPIFDRVGVGAQIKNRIMYKESTIPIKQIDLNTFAHHNKERSATFDDKRNLVSASPKSKVIPAEMKYLEMLQTQRSLYVDRSASANKVNVSLELDYKSNKLRSKCTELKDVLRSSNQQNYYNTHFKPVQFTKMPRKTRDSSNQRYQQ